MRPDAGTAASARGGRGGVGGVVKKVVSIRKRRPKFSKGDGCGRAWVMNGERYEVSERAPAHGRCDEGAGAENGARVRISVRLFGSKKIRDREPRK